jgi:hypothetical protein
MIETYRMLGREHEADLLREAKQRQQASLIRRKRFRGKAFTRSERDEAFRRGLARRSSGEAAAECAR